MMVRFERTDGAPVDHQNDISLAVLNLICAMVFSSRYDLEDLKNVPTLRHRTIAAVVSWLKYLPTELISEIKECTSFRDSLCKKKIQEH